MANYNITRSDGTAVTVQEGQLSTTFSLALLGQNSPAYGANVATNTLRHLENFAHTVPPGGVTLTGQLWYNKSDGTMRVYDGAVWKRTSSVPVSSTTISDNLVPGTSFYDSVRNSLKVYNGVSFRNAVVPGGTVTAEYAGNVTASGNATNYGAKVETIFLTASNATIIPVVAVKYVSDATSGYAGITPDPEHNNASATVMAVFSEREFTIASTDPNYPELSDSFDGTIVRGLNLRNDYTSSFVSQSAAAASADQANALFTGVVIPAADFIHVGRGYVPSVTSTFALGNVTNRFSHLFTDTVTVGNPATPQTMNIEGILDVGNASNSISQLFVNDVTVSGNINFATGVQNVGSSGSPAENLFATNITLTRGTISTTPSVNTDIANKLYVDNALSLGTASQITVTNTPSGTNFLTFVDTATGSENIRANTNLTYNAATNTITADTFSGAHVGNGAGLTNLNAANVSTGTLAVARGGTGVTTSTGTGSVVLSTSPTLVTPALGTPSSGTLTNCTFPTLNQSTTGSAATLTTGRTIALTGDVTYTSGSFNGSTNVTGTATLASVGTAGTYTKVTTDAKGRVTSGTTLGAADIPNLDASKITSGIISADRLPSFVDDVLEFANLAAFPVTGETGKLYVALDTNKVYRWSGTVYIFITSGAVDSVAGKTGVVTLVKADVGLGSVDNTADSAKNVASAAILTTARTIGGVSFNGSANINLPGVNTAGNQNTTGTAENVTGTVAVANGGTGRTTLTSGSYLKGEGTGAIGLQSGIPAGDITSGTLAVARGGTGTSTPALVAGTNITISGSWPNQTINSTASGSGSVTSVGGTGTVNGLTLTGTVTTSGNLTLGGTLAIAATQVTSGTLAVARGGTGVTTSTGTGSVVLSTSPTLVTPALGTPSSGTLTNATGLPIVAGTTGTLSVARGGTGQTSYTNGQLLIGNTTGNTLAKATLTAGAGVTITNGAGAITVAAAATITSVVPTTVGATQNGHVFYIF